MSEVKHTKGPWHVDDADLHPQTSALLGIYVAAPSGGRIGKVFVNCLVDTDDECRANAHLFAGAPGLLWVCKDIRDFLKQIGYDTRLVDAAIAAATGAQS